MYPPADGGSMERATLSKEPHWAKCYSAKRKSRFENDLFRYQDILILELFVNTDLNHDLIFTSNLIWIVSVLIRSQKRGNYRLTFRQGPLLISV
jgi:hypothetical protein